MAMPASSGGTESDMVVSPRKSESMKEVFEVSVVKVEGMGSVTVSDCTEGLASGSKGCITIGGSTVSSRGIACEEDLEARGVSERARSSSGVGGISAIVILACAGYNAMRAGE